MVDITVNEAMVLQKALKGRLGELSNLRSEVASKVTYYGETEKVVEPKYDVKKVDADCVAIENFLMDLDTAIKQSNAITRISLKIDGRSLLSPLS
jgi:flagellar biosynthesis chaperone FliJ